MFAPTKTWRKWHRKVNQNQRRYAVTSALAASAVAPLVMARGHRVEEVAEIPLVLSDSVNGVTKTANAEKILRKHGAFPDVDHAKNSRKIRSGKGKMRNRRHVMRRGPLVVYAQDDGISKAFCNIPGVELAHVDRLNLLDLAPGGHLGRFIIWTQGAFEKLNELYGTPRRDASLKKGSRMPRNIVTNADITRIINSDEVQSVVRGPIKQPFVSRQKKNPLKNLGVMNKLNPYAKVTRRAEIRAQQERAAAKAAGKAIARAKPSAAVKANKKSFGKHLASFENADYGC
jgi:large subunit ribosomal protein L4e